MGWIRLDKAIRENFLWNDGEPMSRGQAWIDLLLRANFEDNVSILRGKPTLIKRGQLHTSILHLAQEWRWSRERVARFLKLLEDEEMIKTERTTHGTTITIVKWGVYQGGCTTDEATDKSTHEATDKSTDKSRYNNNTNKRITNKPEAYFDDDEINEAFKEFIQMRKKMRSPLTDKAIELQISNVKKHSGGNKQTAITIINNSIMNGWKSIYPLKEDKKAKPKQTGFNNFEQREHDASYFEEMERRAIMGG